MSNVQLHVGKKIHELQDLCSFAVQNKSRTLISYKLSFLLHKLFFQIDEAGERSSKDGIGLVTKRFNKSSGGLLIFSSDSFIVNTKGAIYVNGAAMVMMLPILKRGSILTFHTSRISPEKLRVTISIEDKAATFDWCTGCCDNEFLFAISFEHTGWQITVN